MKRRMCETHASPLLDRKNGILEVLKFGLVKCPIQNLRSLRICPALWLDLCFVLMFGAFSRRLIRRGACPRLEGRISCWVACFLQKCIHPSHQAFLWKVDGSRPGDSDVQRPLAHRLTRRRETKEGDFGPSGLNLMVIFMLDIFAG